MLLEKAEEWHCQRCGRCCKTKKINITYSDVTRWENEGRFDILSEVNLVQFKKDVAFTGFYFGKSALGNGCPFLIFDGVKTSCRIYETRPKCCRNQPECIEPNSDKLKDWKTCQGIKNRTQFDESYFRKIREDEHEDLKQAYIHRKQVFEIIRQARLLDPSANLNVNAYVNLSRAGWTYTGTSPYLNLQDQPTNQISTATKSVSTNDFGFADLEAGATTVSAVILNIYCIASASVKSSSVYVWDGASYSTAYTLSMPLAFAYVQIDVTAWLNTVAKVNAAQIYITSAATAQTYTVDHAYLAVTYATAAAYSFSGTETVPVLETLQRVLSLFRQFADAVSTLDSSEQLLSKVQSVSEYVAVLDRSTTISAFQREWTQTISTFDTSQRVSGLFREWIQPISVFDAVESIKGVLRELIETVSVLDTFSPVSQYYRERAEIMSALDFFSKVAQSKRVLSETVSVLDIVATQVGVAGFFVSFAETVTVSDLLTRISQYYREQTETVSAADTVQTIKTILRELVEVVSVLDVLTRVSQYRRVFSETAIVADVLERVVGYKREWIESISILDTVQYLKTTLKELTETVSVLDESTRISRYYRVLSEAVSVLDTIILPFVAYQVSLTETIGILDTFSRQVGFFREFGEVISVIDLIGMTSVVNHIASLTEQIASLTAEVARLAGLLTRARATV